MITIRKNVFETNSSSEHTLVLSPINDEKEFKREYDMIKLHLAHNIKDGFYVIDPDKIDGLTYGRFTEFEDKFLFVFVLLLISGRCGQKLMTERMWENNYFTISKANSVFTQCHKQFVKKICKWMEDVSGIECKGIKIDNYSHQREKNVTKCFWDINHQSLYEAGEEDNCGLKEDVFTVITTIGMSIVYEFC